MIKKEIITINNRRLQRTWSDSGFMIERDGMRYSDAVDPEYTNRNYTETDEPIETVELSKNELSDEQTYLYQSE